jgi:hypothetical protein
VSRRVDLTLLASDIVAAILDDQLPEIICFIDVAVNPSAGWHKPKERPDSADSCLGM